MKYQMTRRTTLRELIAEENELRYTPEEIAEKGDAGKDLAEKLDENEIATEIFILTGTEEYGKNIFVDLDDGEVFTQEGSLSFPESDSIHYVGTTAGEFSGWECEKRYETLTDEDGDEYEGDFIGFTCDDGETFYDTREEAIEAEIRENGLDADSLDPILDCEVEVTYDEEYELG